MIDLPFPLDSLLFAEASGASSWAVPTWTAAAAQPTDASGQHADLQAPATRG